jgi:hypothetical protein
MQRKRWTTSLPLPQSSPVPRGIGRSRCRWSDYRDIALRESLDADNSTAMPPTWPPNFRRRRSGERPRSCLSSSQSVISGKPSCMLPLVSGILWISFSILCISFRASYACTIVDVRVGTWQVHAKHRLGISGNPNLVLIRVVSNRVGNLTER